jgi:hypothetical protein
MAIVDDRAPGTELAWQGIDLCRQGDWRQGLDLLRRVADAKDPGIELPGLFYSYLGFGVARFDRRVREGLTLCEHAVKREFYQPENYLNLARTHLLAGNRRKAMSAVLAGRRIDRAHRGLAELHRELGLRRRPVLPFLSRTNPLNRLLGRMRHDWKSSDTKDGD